MLAAASHALGCATANGNLADIESWPDYPSYRQGRGNAHTAVATRVECREGTLVGNALVGSNDLCTVERDFKSKKSVVSSYKYLRPNPISGGVSGSGRFNVRHPPRQTSVTPRSSGQFGKDIGTEDLYRRRVGSLYGSEFAIRGSIWANGVQW